MSKPKVLVFAGPNGSGKSTVTALLPHYGVYINADDLKKEYALTDIESAQKAEALRNKLVEKKADFTFETVLSTKRNLLLLRKAKENGYEVHCIYVLTCNADINVARVRSRVHEGGHDVPEEKIRSRYVKALKLLPQIIDVCDKIFIYDNSIMPAIIYKKDKKGSDYFPTDIWPLKKLKEILKQYN
ncbi:MAG: zeta toxin family protein [Treponema sp.]|jgi:predicted ABC-type ATPase|nr:zeta toxin family protein [Treponema sp.]